MNNNLEINSADGYNNKNWILFVHILSKDIYKKCGCSQYTLIMPNTNRYWIPCNTVTNVRAVT